MDCFPGWNGTTVPSGTAFVADLTGKTDIDGVASTQTVDDFKVFEDRESTHGTLLAGGDPDVEPDMVVDMVVGP